jgi:hypothetical protein
METLQEVLDLIAAADVAVDSAQEILSELMGVPNPDDEADAGRQQRRPRRLVADEAASGVQEHHRNGPDPADVRERLRLRRRRPQVAHAQTRRRSPAPDAIARRTTWADHLPRHLPFTPDLSRKESVMN